MRSPWTDPRTGEILGKDPTVDFMSLERIKSVDYWASTLISFRKTAKNGLKFKGMDGKQ